MPSKEIKELRQAGRLDDALTMARAELDQAPNNIWAKRNISWVYYELGKKCINDDDFNGFINNIKLICDLDLPDNETMLADNLCWLFGMMAWALLKKHTVSFEQYHTIFEYAQKFKYTKDADGYAYLLKVLHRALKESLKYTDIIEWWGLENLKPEHFLKEKLPNGKEVMSFAEQVYISYAKSILPKTFIDGHVVFDRQKAENLIPVLEELQEKYADFQFTTYFAVKLMLALDNKDNALKVLLPFARRKSNDFWVWQELGDVLVNQPDTQFSCYCRALSCYSPEEMLVNLRLKMAKAFESRNMFNEAKTELEMLVKARDEKNWPKSLDASAMQLKDWYKAATANDDNRAIYNQHKHLAEELLFFDIPAENVIVEFVNTDKKMLNFIASDTKFGFFKYERFLNSVNVGDILSVKFNNGKLGELYKVYTVVKTEDAALKSKYIKEVQGVVVIKEGNSFGFVHDIFINPSLIAKIKLFNGASIHGNAMKTYNKLKMEWTYKLIDCAIME